MAETKIRKELEECARSLEAGTLQPQRLRDLAAAAAPRQSLLYAQAFNTDVESELLGYTLVVNGERIVGPENPDEWPYQSVAAAIKEGWRIISFPNMALLLDENRTFGYGCEFVLERLE